MMNPFGKMMIPIQEKAESIQNEGGWKKEKWEAACRVLMLKHACVVSRFPFVRYAHLSDCAHLFDIE